MNQDRPVHNSWGVSCTMLSDMTLGMSDGVGQADDLDESTESRPRSVR